MTCRSTIPRKRELNWECDGENVDVYVHRRSNGEVTYIAAPKGFTSVFIDALERVDEPLPRDHWHLGTD